MTDDSRGSRVFISYSWDSEEHIDWVVGLARRLTNDGIDVIIDQWNTRLASDLAVFMETGLTSADRVIVISSAEYVRKANDSLGGAGYEKRIMSAQIMRDLTSNRVAPLVRNNGGPDAVPTFLNGLKYVDFRDDAGYEEKYRDLIHDLYGRLVRERPPLGRSPFASVETADGDANSFSDEPLFEPVANAPTVVWRRSLGGRRSGYFSTNTLVEVELVPLDDNHLVVANPQSLTDELASLGRQNGFFTAAQPLSLEATASEAWVRADEYRDLGERGLVVTKTGQRGFWLALPRDGLGSMLDPLHLAPSLAAAIRMIARLSIPAARRYAIALEMSPVQILTIGSISELGSRTRSSTPRLKAQAIRLGAEDSVLADRLSASADEVARNVAERLALRITT